jgi:hypothetical protein
VPFGYSPKLGRRVSFHSRSAFEHWLGLESDPTALSFCERPAMMNVEGHERVLEMWVRHAGHEEFQLIADDGAKWPGEWMGIRVRRIGVADLAASRMWVSNWERMLPVINLTRDCVSKQHLSDVERYIREPMPLARIEREFVTGDPMWIRGAVFRLLATGRLVAPALRTERLSLQTLFELAP